MLKTHSASQTCSLQEQINQAKPGDCIELPQGIYHPGTLILPHGGDEQNPIVIKACPGHRVILRGDAPLLGDWEKVDSHIWRMQIPLTYT